MRYGLVGVGRWGQVYLKVLRELGLDLAATCSGLGNSYNNLPQELKTAPHFHSLLPMFLHAGPIDTVIIATHPSSHYELSVYSLNSGKNVICEKPCMFTQSQFERISYLTKSSKLKFVTDYTNIYHKIVVQMKSIVDSYSGKYYLNLSNSGAGPFRSYSDLWDYGSHITSIIYYLFPSIYFDKILFGKTQEGNHSLFLESLNADVYAEFGNKSIARKHHFEMTAKNGKHISWDNDKSENPLKEMLRNFDLGYEETNIQLSRKIHWLLSQGE